jgi:hypothetical protein
MTLILVSVLGCIPREDLSDYSRTWPNQPSGTGGSTAAPGDANAGVDAGSPPPPFDAGPSIIDAAVVDSVDAGSLRDAGPRDAGVDAGPAAIDSGTIEAADAAASLAAPALAALCTGLSGSLEPGTNNCFAVSTTTATWENAVADCNARDMTLATVTTSAQDDFIATLTPAAAWIGASDPAFFTFPAFANPAANAFSWLDGSAVLDINWAPGEPNAGVGEFCVEKSNQAGGEPWFDRSCTQLALYVCQREL